MQVCDPYDSPQRQIARTVHHFDDYYNEINNKIACDVEL